MNKYEQQTTITLSQAEAISLRCALEHSLRTYREQLGAKAIENAHPKSAIGETKALLDELQRAACGHENLDRVTWKMVKTA